MTSLAVRINGKFVAEEPNRPRSVQVVRAELLARLLVLLCQGWFGLNVKRLRTSERKCVTRREQTNSTESTLNIRT